MSGDDPQRDLLARATAAIERIDATVARQAKSFDRQAKAFDRQTEAFDRQAERLDGLMRWFASHQELMISALNDIDASIRRNTERLEDMGDAIRANTRAVLSALDRLGPA